MSNEEVEVSSWIKEINDFASFWQIFMTGDKIDSNSYDSNNESFNPIL